MEAEIAVALGLFPAKTTVVTRELMLMGATTRYGNLSL